MENTGEDKGTVFLFTTTCDGDDILGCFLSTKSFGSNDTEGCELILDLEYIRVEDFTREEFGFVRPGFRLITVIFTPGRTEIFLLFIIGGGGFTDPWFGVGLRAVSSSLESVLHKILLVSLGFGVDLITEQYARCSFLEPTFFMLDWIGSVFG